MAALEEALERRSRALRRLQQHLDPRALTTLARVERGLPPLLSGAFDPDLWHETTTLARADVEETLRELWRSLGPSEPGPDAA